MIIQAFEEIELNTESRLRNLQNLEEFQNPPNNESENILTCNSVPAEIQLEFENRQDLATCVKSLKFDMTNLGQSHLVENLIWKLAYNSIIYFFASIMYLILLNTTSDVLFALGLLPLVIVPLIHSLVLAIYYRRNFNSRRIETLKILFYGLISSGIGFSDFFLIQIALPVELIVSLRTFQIVLQVAFLCAFNFGNIVPLVFWIMYTIAYYRMFFNFIYDDQLDLKSPKINLKTNLMVLLETTSKIFLNWFDIISDIIFISTTNFAHIGLLVSSIILMFLCPFLQALLHYLKSERYLSSFLKTYVTAILGVYEAQIGFQHFIKPNESLKCYIECIEFIHAIFENLCQIFILITNSVLIGELSTSNIISLLFSSLSFLLTFATSLHGAMNIFKLKGVPPIQRKFLAEVSLSILFQGFLIQILSNWCDDLNFYFGIVVWFILIVSFAFGLFTRHPLTCKCLRYKNIKLMKSVVKMFYCKLIHRKSTDFVTKLHWLIFYFVCVYIPITTYAISNSIICFGDIDGGSAILLVGYNVW